MNLFILFTNLYLVCGRSKSTFTVLSVCGMSVLYCIFSYKFELELDWNVGSRTDHWCRGLVIYCLVYLVLYSIICIRGDRNGK